MTPFHLGGLHPFEQGLTLLLAFGPFVALGVVVWLRRREDAEDPEDADDPAVREEDPGPVESSSGTGPGR